MDKKTYQTRIKRTSSQHEKLINIFEKQKIIQNYLFYIFAYMVREPDRKEKLIYWKEFITYIEQNLYFDNMDLKYKKNIDQNRNI